VTRRRPFVGLEPYEEQDASFFFGREREERILVGNLRGFRLTILYGASAVGKSSVPAAGVVHRLRERVAW
jgi:AAA+ ATPase superfamily predicted ATPase